jgi:hypothetical protein
MAEIYHLGFRTGVCWAAVAEGDQRLLARAGRAMSPTVSRAVGCGRAREGADNPAHESDLAILDLKGFVAGFDFIIPARRRRVLA